MTSINDLVLGYNFANDATATDKVSAANLQTQLQAVVAYINTLRQSTLEPNLRGDNAITDQLILLRMLNPEVTNLIASKAGWQPKTAATVIATTNLTLSGEQTIDSILTATSRVVVNGQTLAKDNGIYLTGAGAWTRVTDADTAAELGYAYIRVSSGLVYGSTLWVLTQAVADITLGTTSLTFAQCGGVSGVVPITQATTDGPPITGTWIAGSAVRDSRGLVYVCITGGTPGTWYALGNKCANLVDNADMAVDQRQATTAVAIPTGSAPPATIDRWYGRRNNYAVTWTLQQVADAPTAAGTATSLRGAITAAGGAIGATDFAAIGQWLRGMSRLAWGTASAKPVYIGFWVKSYVTGTFSVSLVAQSSRSYVHDVTITAANTWQFVTFAIPGDQASTLWNTDWGTAKLSFCFGCGTAYRAPSTDTWNSNEYYGSAATSNFLTSVSATGVQITAVKLSEDPNTVMEPLSFDANLDACQMAYYKSFPYATLPAQNAGVSGAIAFPQYVPGGVTTSQPLFLPRRMYTTPSLTTFNPSAANAQVRNTTAAVDCTATAATAASGERAQIGFAANGASVAAQSLIVHVVADTFK